MCIKECTTSTWKLSWRAYHLKCKVVYRHTCLTKKWVHVYICYFCQTKNLSPFYLWLLDKNKYSQQSSAYNALILKINRALLLQSPLLSSSQLEAWPQEGKDGKVDSLVNQKSFACAHRIKRK